MSFPHTHLLPGPSRTICVSGPHITVLDNDSGAVVASVEREDIEKSKNGPIRIAAADRAQKHLATSSDDKRLRVWEVETLKLLSERELPKKATDVLFTQDGQTILLSDKFGDVFAYPLHPPPAEKEEKKKEKDGLASHENPSNGDLVLGHVSLLTACILTHDERYIITADRDEHIRVSWYPQAYQIESFCLGNEKFVSALHIPASVPNRLISGGGDPVLRVWDWMSGTLIREIPVMDAVEPTIKVKSLKRKWGEDGEGSAPRKKKRKGKGKAKADADVQETAADDADEKLAEAPEPEEEGKTILAVHKIATLRDAEDQPLQVLFSAVGSTALFACPFEEVLGSIVQVFDLGVPVLDFGILADGRILVSLDFQWGDETSSPRSSVRCLQLADSKLVESPEQSPLVESINAIVKPATNQALDALDLYGALASMPKFNVPGQEEEGEATPAPDEPMTKRQLGRMRNKSAVQARKAAVAGTGDASVDIGAESKCEDERESKRARSDEGEQATEATEHMKA